MENGKVSIVVPVYNVEKYLSRCIQSIIIQTYTDLEIILVDDGSTDKSSLLCDKWALKDSRIEVIHQNNQGVSAARNAALKKISGSYVLFVDSDDWIEINMVEFLVNKIKSAKDVDAVFCGYKEVEDMTENIIKVVTPKKKGVVERNIGVAEIFGSYSTMLWNKLFKTCLLDDKSFFDESIKIGEDELWMVNVLKKARNIFLIDTPLYFYRNRQSGVSKDFTLSKARMTEIDSQKKVLDSIAEYKNSELILCAQKRLYYSCQKIMKIAYYQKNYELFEKLDEEIDDVRKIWYSHHNNLLGSFRRKLVEQMMRLKFPASIVKIFDK